MIAPRTDYSSELSGYLEIGGARHALSQLGPEFLILCEAVESPPAQAEIVLFHDGQESRLAVALPNGIASSRTKIAYQRLPTNS